LREKRMRDDSDYCKIVSWLEMRIMVLENIIKFYQGKGCQVFEREIQVRKSELKIILEDRKR
jgi:hypothetical protein